MMLKETELINNHWEETNFPWEGIWNTSVAVVPPRTRDTAHWSFKSSPWVVHRDTLPRLYAKGGAGRDSDLTEEKLGSYALTRWGARSVAVVDHTDRAYSDRTGQKRSTSVFPSWSLECGPNLRKKPAKSQLREHAIKRLTTPCKTVQSYPNKRLRDR